MINININYKKNGISILFTLLICIGIYLVFRRSDSCVESGNICSIKITPDIKIQNNHKKIKTYYKKFDDYNNRIETLDIITFDNLEYYFNQKPFEFAKWQHGKLSDDCMERSMSHGDNIETNCINILKKFNLDSSYFDSEVYYSGFDNEFYETRFEIIILNPTRKELLYYSFQDGGIL